MRSFVFINIPGVTFIFRIICFDAINFSMAEDPLAFPDPRWGPPGGRHTGFKERSILFVNARSRIIGRKVR